MNMRAHRPTGAELRPDIPAYVRSLGLASDRLPSRTFQSTPTRHRGRHAGNFHLVEKEGGEEFTSEESPAPSPARRQQAPGPRSTRPSRMSSSRVPSGA